MAAKIEMKNFIPNWYELTNNINKQLNEINNLGGFDYNLLQDSWRGYTKIMNKEMNKVIKLDEKQYNNMVHFWNEFKSSMNTEISKLINFEKENYNLIYHNLLVNIDRNNNELYEKIIRHTKEESRLFELFEKIFYTLGYSDNQAKQLVRTSKTLIDLEIEVFNSVRIVFNNSISPENIVNYFDESQKLNETWMVSYSNIIKQLTNIFQFESWQKFYRNQNTIFMDIAEQSFNTFFDNFHWIWGEPREKLLTEFRELKDKFDDLSRDLKNYDGLHTSSLSRASSKSIKMNEK